MRRLLLAAAMFAMIMAPHSAEAWGFDVHRLIKARAIPLLPPEIRPFFDKYRETVVEHSIDPDLWRLAGWTEEVPRHFIDLDAYGAYPFKAMPRDYDEAVKRYGKDFVDKNGTLPWRTEEIYTKLVEAFGQQGPFSADNIKFFASVIAHYVGDAHVPFHAALNYDGQLTGQWGIHARFETELFQRYKDKLRLTPGPLLPVANPRDFVFESLTAGFPLVQPVLDADKAAIAGREAYDDQYFTQFFAKVQPILERRLSESIIDVASIITAAWQAAGRPAVPLEQRRLPRKVRRQ
jgi:hypothetical protein